ncbi:MAG: acetate--CoA ligase family protein [Desulfohalobiaceae bacterium]|nr:acetate--CoA ligase family protein [Desulfohalobiaceae bacterium]
MDRILKRVFNPRSIAVIGASEVPGKAAERRTRSLIQGGYQGDIYLINPKRSELFGRKAYPSITEIGAEVDLVMVIVPPRFLVGAVKDSIKMGAKGIIIITAGLGESGEEGKKIETEILEEAAKSGTYIIGPNCSGMYSGSAAMNILGIPSLQKGSISVLAQSGNVIDSLTNYAYLKGVGFSRIISVGNAIGVNFHEYIQYLKDDPETKVIIAYLEGIKEGGELVRVARETVKKKPIIALKVGRSGAGARAAASHTGSLAGDDVIVEAAFKQAGIVRVSNVDELFDMADVFSKSPMPRGNRVAILSEGGGDNSIAADNAELFGMEVPVLGRETQDKIRPFLLAGMPASNPIDYGGTAEENPKVIAECVRVCMEDEEVDAVYLTGFFGGFQVIIAPHVADLEKQTAEELVRLVKEYKKPLFVHTSFAGQDIAALKTLRDAGIPVFESSGRSARCLGELMRFSRRRQAIASRPKPSGKTKDSPGVKDILAKVRGQDRNNLLETESRKLLKEYKVPLPGAIMATDPEQAVQAAEGIGYPVALKIVSPDIVHKSDAGGIRLNLSDDELVKNAFLEIVVNAARVTSRDRILGALVSPMAGQGQECILGMIRDPQFGPVIMFGLGGVFVEVLRDVAFRVAPLTPEDALEMIEEIKGYRLLTGIRGESPKDIRALTEVLLTLSDIALQNPEIAEIDLNPVIVHEQGLSIVDSRVITDFGHRT